MSDNNNQTAKKTVLQIYAVFGASLLLSLVPIPTAAFFSFVFGVGVLIAAYALRKKNDEGSLIENHMTFIIRTIWIGSFFAMITTVVGSIYLFLNIDNAPLEPCMNDLVNHAQNITGLRGLETVFGNCYEPYWVINAHAFITSFAIVALPVLVYFSVRYARGLARAANGYRVANHLGWF